MLPSTSKRTAASLAFVLASLAVACQSESPKNRTSPAIAPADLVLRGGPVYTLDAARSRARALAVRDGVLVYVGTEGGVAPFIAEHTRVVALGERSVLPSFQDVHIHPIYAGLQASILCDLSGDENVEAYQATIARCAQEQPDAPIHGGGWYMNAFPLGIPDRRTIDAVVPDRPVYLSSADGHSAWLNSKALAVAGITRETPDPPGGRIDRDPQTGEPVGALQEGAMELVELPTFTREQLHTGLRTALEHLNGLGITAFQDASERDSASRRDIETYREFDAQGALTARVVASLWWDHSRGIEQVDGLVARRAEFTGGRLAATTVKIMQDGVLENHTASLLEPYLGMDERGMSYVEPELLKEVVTRLDRDGFQVHFHAIGDAAIRQSLDAVEAARKSNGDRGNRHHISHIELFDPADIPRFRQLGVAANFQPLWAFADEYITDLTIPFLGPERSRFLYPIRSLLDSGAVVAFGSDWNVSSANPFEEMEVAVTRMGPDGETDTPFLPEQRIDLASALAAFTINAAYVNGLEDRTGSIEVGKLADLIVVDRDPFEVAPSELSELRVLLTLLEGQPVHGGWSL